MTWYQTPKGKARKKAYRLANREKVAAYLKAYRAVHAERIAAQQKAYHAAHKKRILEGHKAWLAANDVHVTAYTKEYNAAYRATNAERLAALKRAYYAANREQESEKRKEWNAANPEKRAAHHARRKARLRGAAGSHTLQEWKAKCAEYDHRCAYCGEAKRLTRDHVVPVSAGGSDFIENIVPACASCNSRKHARPAEEFRSALLQRTG